MNTKQIKKRYIFLIIIVILLVFFIFTKSSSYNFESSDKTEIIESTLESKTPEVLINNTIIAVDLARTNAQVQRGLSGRPSLDPQSGMLFIFSKPSIYSFWMPDMNFPLDLIWISNDIIVDISHNVTNVFDRAHPVYYKPKEPAQYVLEVNANFSINHNIKIGDTVIFKNILLNL